MIESKNIFTEIKLRFPFFLISGEMENLPVVAFSFLCKYLEDEIKNDNHKVVNDFVHFVNELTETEDETLTACLDEIFLGLYTSSEVNYGDFKKKLNEIAQKEFEKTISLWDGQYKN